MSKTITYAITVCNEVTEFQKCFDIIYRQVQAFREKGIVDNIVIQQDSNALEQSVNSIRQYLSPYSEDCVQYHVVAFQNNFSDYRNTLNSHCTGNYIFQIDADELVSNNVGEFLHRVIDNYPDLDLVAFPRENRVEGITSSDMAKWGWINTVKGINWPDYQFRFYRNTPDIYWQGTVHERPTGFRKWTVAPEEQALRHFKSIEKQRSQNKFYDKLHNYNGKEVN